MTDLEKLRKTIDALSAIKRAKELGKVFGQPSHGELLDQVIRLAEDTLKEIGI